jgi:ATP-binding cassette subfamily B multidrug efflux pump
MQSDADNDKTKGASKDQAFQALGLLRRAAEPDRIHLKWATGWLILAAALEVLGPLLGKKLIDDHLLPHHLDWTRMALLLGGVLLTGWAASWLRFLQLVRLSGLAMRSVQRLREWVYGHVLRLPMAFFDKAITGQLVSRVTNDTEAVKTLYIQVLFVILDSSIVLVGTSIAMAWLDWRLMLIVLALVPAVLGIVWLYQKLSAPAVTRARALRSDINAQMAESIGGMSVLQANNAQHRFGERFAGTNEQHYKARVAELRANAFLLRPALDFLNVVLLAVVIFSFGQRSMNGIEVGVLYAFISYIARVVEPLIQITMQFSGLQQAVVATARVSALLDETGAPEHGRRRVDAGAADGRKADGAANMDPDAPAVRVRNLNFAYIEGQTVLHDLSLEIPRGAFFGIVGHTGSGKSTLLSLLLRYYPATRGSIELYGEPLAAIDNERFRSEVGLVPQDGGVGAREHRHGTRTVRRRHRSGGARGPCPRLHHGAGERLRHPARRRRLAPVVRPEAVDRDRARPGRQAARAAAGRSHLAHRQPDRADRAAGADRIARQGDRDRDRAPAVDDPRRRPHRRAEPRPH